MILINEHIQKNNIKTNYERFSDSSNIYYYEYLSENIFTGTNNDSIDLFSVIDSFVNPFSQGNTIVTFECKFKSSY